MVMYVTNAELVRLVVVVPRTCNVGGLLIVLIGRPPTNSSNVRHSVPMPAAVSRAVVMESTALRRCEYVAPAAGPRPVL